VLIFRLLTDWVRWFSCSYTCFNENTLILLSNISLRI